jgi:DNA-binding transcriptional regulator of glucitol operon
MSVRTVVIVIAIAVVVVIAGTARAWWEWRYRPERYGRPHRQDRGVTRQPIRHWTARRTRR